MAKINQLPYFHFNNTKQTNEIARFLFKKIKKLLKEKYPYHYLIFSRTDKKLLYLQNLSKKYPYFLKLDIEKFYPSINHKILLANLWRSSFYHFDLSRRLKHYLKYEIPEFLKKSPVSNQGIAIGNYLGWILTGLYLLPLDLKIPRPFLRVQDDYLIFCKNKKEPEKILKEIIEPELNKLELNLNLNKLNSGKFHQNSLEFMGFRYYAGIFTISEKKIINFKNKIIKITHLTKKKSTRAVIKSLNNKILGFGHYYKLCSSKQDFEKLDAFIRQRLRRYLIKNKDQKQKIGNLLLTNQDLENLGLKSLTKIKEKYDSKKRHILEKSNKKKGKIGNPKKYNIFRKSDLWLDDYEQKAILKQLQELTKNVKQIKKEIQKIERKLEE